MCVSTSTFAIFWSQIKQIGVIYSHMEVVGRGSERQLQGGDNLNKILKSGYIHDSLHIKKIYFLHHQITEVALMITNICN